MIYSKRKENSSVTLRQTLPIMFSFIYFGKGRTQCG